MLWTLGLTKSYIESINLNDEHSVRNLYDVLEYVSDSPNLILADDKDKDCLIKLNSLLENSDILPEYQSKLGTKWSSLINSIQIEKDRNSKKK